MQVAEEKVQTRLARAEKLVRSGRIGVAERILRDVLSDHPGNRRARDGLQRLATARAEVLAPRDRLARLQALCDRATWPEALAEADLLARLWPRDPAVHHAGAAIRLALDAPEAAAALAARALEIDPDHAPSAQVLGEVLLRQGRPSDAETCFRDALRSDPDLAPARRGLGRALMVLGRPDAAAEWLATAAEQASEDAGLRLALAEALAAAGRAEAALAAHDAAASLAPDDPRIRSRRAILLKNMGRRAEAEAGFAQALDLAPQQGAAWANFARLHRFAPGDPRLAALDAALARDDLSPGDRACLHFARAKASEDLDDTATAFDHFVRANALRHGRIGHDVATDRTQFDRIRRAFSHPLPPAPDVAPARPRPIFVTGMPRSGTTLCEEILAAHPEVTALGELDLLAPAVNAARIGAGPLRADHLRAIRDGYLSALAQRVGGATVVTDKMPFNFRMVGHILLALPEARVLHLRRDPRATCWSNFRTDFEDEGPALGYAWSLRNIVDYHRLHDDLMAFWHRRFPGRIHQVHYESLTEDPEPAVRALLAHADLPWSPGCLDFHQSDRPVRTASDLQVRRPIFTGSSEAWRRYADHLAPITEVWGDGRTPRDPGPGNP